MQDLPSLPFWDSIAPLPVPLPRIYSKLEHVKNSCQTPSQFPPTRHYLKKCQTSPWAGSARNETSSGCFASFCRTLSLPPHTHAPPREDNLSGTLYSLGLLKEPSPSPSFSSEEAGSSLQEILGPSGCVCLLKLPTISAVSNPQPPILLGQGTPFSPSPRAQACRASASG